MEHFLEDDFTHVIQKAFRGMNIPPSEAALRAGISKNDILSFTRGTFSATTARRLAPILGLNAEALASYQSYRPKRVELKEINRLDLPFGSNRVNAWLISTSDTAILFDTGYDMTSCSIAVDSFGGPKIDRVFLTHNHHDHIGGISSFTVRGNILHSANIDQTLPMVLGESMTFGLLTVRACDLSGHAIPALGFHVGGLTLPVLVTGDALFAGSIGGCATPTSYQHALKRLQDVLAPLPDSTILLPGHGPATTLGEERMSNPFLSQE